METLGILAINPGSTSTKIAVFNGSERLFVKTLRHSPEELKPFEKVTDQFEFRKNVILNELHEAGIQLDNIKAIVGRGGVLKPIPSGVYEVNEAMKRDLRDCVISEHASNLGGLIAADLAKSLPGARAFIADPVVVDELQDIARYAGHPLFSRVSIFHALNHKAIARKHAAAVNRKYEDMNMIVVHLGGGISVGAHYKGKVIDVNQALDGEGPFSPERSGTLPVAQLVKVCFSGKYTEKEIHKMIKGQGGLVAYTGSNNAYEVELRAEKGDQPAHDAFYAMAYQVCKEIGAMGTVLKGQVDCILLTGGIANSKCFNDYIIERVQSIAPVFVYPGEDEMEALAENGIRVMNGETQPLIYS